MLEKKNPNYSKSITLPNALLQRGWFMELHTNNTGKQMSKGGRITINACLCIESVHVCVQKKEKAITYFPRAFNFRKHVSFSPSTT